MKILVLENGPDELKQLMGKLIEWGHQLFFLEQEDRLYSSLQKTPEIQLVILGETEKDTIELVQNIRKSKQYIYIFRLGKKGEAQLVTEFLDAGVDDVLITPFDWEELRYRLLAANRLLRATFQYTVDFTKLEKNQKIQVLNWESALINTNQERELLQKLLQIFIDTAKELEVKISTLQSDLWEELYQNAESLGAEELTEWLAKILLLKKQSQHYQTINFAVLQEQFYTILRRLKEGFESLKDSGFFFTQLKNDGKGPLEGTRILLVEDLLHNRILVKQILKKHQCEIVEAENGQIAVDFWQQEQNYDLVIMDMNMPVMDGFGATRLIRAQEQELSLRRTPILALTALAMRGDEERCLAAGCDGYMPKPVDAAHLIKACENLISDKKHVAKISESSFPSLRINKSLLKSANQIHHFVLHKLFKDLGVELSFLENATEMISELISEEYDLLILDAEFDLELAYQIKERFPLQHIVLIVEESSSDRWMTQESGSVISYPFNKRNVEIALQHFSLQLKQTRKNADMLADVNSLKDMKGQVSIEACVEKSDNQLVVWQKAFRKIGGDLVLSQEFDYHGRFGFILADVAGHDIKSGYAASWFAGLVKGLWGQYSNPIDLLIYLNNLFSHDSDEEDKRFVCALVLLWDRVRNKLHYANAGIPGGILVRADSGEEEIVDWKGVPIGLFPNMDMFDHGVLDFFPGDRLYMATDGILEAIPPDIIIDLSKEKGHQKPSDALDAIVDFTTRSIEINDDLTISLFEAQAQPEPEQGFRTSIGSTFQEVEQVMAKTKTFIEETLPVSFDWQLISVGLREALINAVEHGNGKKAELPIDIDLEWNDHVLQLRVSDRGGGFDIASVKKRLKEEGDLRIQGRGLELMENIAHSVSYKGGGVQLEFLPEEST